MSQQILRYRNDTLEFVDVFATLPGIDPTGFAFAPNGDVYVAGYRTDEVRRLSAAGVPIDTPVPARAAGLDGPDNGITFAPDGNLYVPGYDSSSVVRHDPRTGATTVAVPSRRAGLFHTRGLLPDRAGNALFITGEGSGQLLRLDLATGAVSVLATGLIGPTGIDYAPDGNLLVLEGDTVRRYDPATGARKEVLIAPGSGDQLRDVSRRDRQAGAAEDGGRRVLPPASRPLLHQRAGRRDRGARLRRAFRMGAHRSRVRRLPRVRRPGTSPVCRFYLPPANGDSHFYSASPAECAEVRAKFPTFVFEAPDVMHVALPDVATRRVPGGTLEGVPAVEQPRGFESSLHGGPRCEGDDAFAGLRRGGLRAGRDDHVRGGVR